MPTENETASINDGDWIVRVKPPEQTANTRTMLLIHGWTGNETVMWIFTNRLPKNYWLFAPRAPVPAGGGYAWLPHDGGWPTLEDFTAPAEALLQAFARWAEQAGAPHDTFDVMGFSQGAAMAYALAALYPHKVNRVLALAGFLPRDDQGGEPHTPGRYAALKGKDIYIAHGSQDDIVPVRMAEEAVQTLQTAGAQVTYCASDTGHKLSASCLRGLEEFIL
jgi:phospholipase/carboxylesterase